MDPISLSPRAWTGVKSIEKTLFGYNLYDLSKSVWAPLRKRGTSLCFDLIVEGLRQIGLAFLGHSRIRHFPTFLPHLDRPPKDQNLQVPISLTALLHPCAVHKTFRGDTVVPDKKNIRNGYLIFRGAQVRMTGDDLKQWRAELGLTQEAAARALKVSKSTIAQYEIGVSGGRTYVIPSIFALACSAIKEGLNEYGFDITEAPVGGRHPYVIDARPMTFDHKIDPRFKHWCRDVDINFVVIEDGNILTFDRSEAVKLKMRWGHEGSRKDNYRALRGRLTPEQEIGD